jgi:hypothetical protein
MARITLRDAERTISRLERQRDVFMRVLRMWVYLAAAAVLTLLISGARLWGLLYLVLFLAWLGLTWSMLRRAAASD